ncbi:unknown [Sulfolobus spindle-shaped virus 6]|uniref:ASCH domain-containing protein n=1 Tax=Sulfolobus spindle-shaped virus 6 TaxID=693627 RepID=D1GF29_9VIRU|nr:hypothetical protein SSSV6_gp11 [Sulfolobus spindle-shaped virus 6]ACZ35731.1 unknown [Sulfolobus spindle-shaped virus 6]
MIFNSKVVRNYILNGAKVVATIRKRSFYKIGQKVVINVGDRKFPGKVIAIAPITLDSLSKYVDYSGFNSVEEWLYEARRLHGTGIDPYRYEIIVVEVTREVTRNGRLF